MLSVIVVMCAFCYGLSSVFLDASIFVTIL